MTFFLVCFGIGLVFLIITAILGGLMDFGGHFHLDLGGADGALGGGVHFSPFSPTFIAFFLTVFGGFGGISMSLWHISFAWSIVIALVTSIGLALLIFMGLSKIFETTQGGVEVNVADMAGREAEVIIGIPDGGMGEIAFITAGGRLNGPARSEDGKPIPINATVEIVKVVGNTYIVHKKG